MNTVSVLLVLVGWALLPGVAVAVLTSDRVPDTRSVERAVTAAIVGGTACLTLLARLTDRAGWLTATTAWVGAAILGGISLVVVVSRRTTALRIAAASWRAWAWMAACLLPALPMLRWLAADRDTLVNPTPWYYSDLVRQTVSAHGAPAWSYEWGRRVPFLDDYPGFTAGAAILRSVTRNSSLASEHIVTVFVLLTTALAVALFVRAIGASRFGAFIGVAIVMLSTVYISKLLSFRPEAAGYPLTFLIPVLAIDWMETKRRSSLVLGAVGIAALGQIHGIDFTLSAIFIVVALGVVSATRVRNLRRSVTDACKFLGAMAGAWLISAGLWSGDLSGLIKVGGLPRVVDGVDPTFRFNALVTRMGDLGHPPTTGAIVGNSLRFGLLGVGWHWTPVLVGISALVLALCAWRGGPSTRTRYARLLIFPTLAILAVLAVGLMLSLRWETYVPRRTGLDRMLHLWPVLMAVVVGGAAGALVEFCDPKRRRIAATLVVVGGLGLAVLASSPLAAVAHQHPPAEQTDVLRQLDLGPPALVLMNSYTESYPKVAAGIEPVLNGRAPYTDKKLLKRAIRLLDDSRAFFGSVRRPLPCRGITHVVAAADTNSRFATPNVFGTDLGQLGRNPDLRLVKSAPGVTVFAVRPGAWSSPVQCSKPPEAK